jgi:hypothetical protein
LAKNKQKTGRNMKVVLKKDIVIPAGTILDKAPTKTERFGDGHVDVVIGLSDNTSGTFTYCVDENMLCPSAELAEWFEAVD